MWCRGHHSFADAFLYRSVCFVVQMKLDVLKTTITTRSLGNRGLIDDTAAWGPFGNSLRVFERVGRWERDEHLVCWIPGKSSTCEYGDSAWSTVCRLLMISFLEQRMSLFFMSGTRCNCVEFISMSRFPKHGFFSMATSSKSHFSITANATT